MAAAERREQITTVARGLSAERALELTARMVRHGLLGLTAWWREHPETPRAVLVEHAMAVSWTGLRALRKRGR